jgi:3-phenylpropionate/trans-cinnamate dioxygenase ferredoxin reductase subunit
MSGHGLVIIGGSYAAQQIAASARECGYAEPITLISDEAFLPYQRPPLSKGFPSGKVEQDALILRPDSFYAENRIDLMLDTRVEQIDRQKKIVVTAGGQSIPYDKLAIATGARARLFKGPGAELDGVLPVRSLADAIDLRDRAPKVSEIVVIGGGFIGLEVASALRTLGKTVTVIEFAPRLLGRAVGPILSDFMADYHRAQGVHIVLNESVTEIRGENGRVTSVLCSKGDSFPADLVVVGIGALPNTELAEAAGLACRDGIIVDEHARTSDPDIVAAGDCTRHPSVFAGKSLRLESVQNALDQAKIAGATLAGLDKVYDTVPWFWSDQYTLNLQMVGLADGHDQSVMRGSVEEGKFSLFYYKAGNLVGVESVSRPSDHAISRRILAGRIPVTPEQAADPSVDLRALLKAAKSAAG